MRDHSLCGWRVRSAWPLPELLAWNGDDRTPDISIRLGQVPAELDGTVRKTPLVQVNECGWLRYAVRNVATYLVRDGNEVIIDTPHAPDTADVALFLLGSVLGFLCHQRGLLPLHASCIALEGKVVALAGHSGAGKSTLAALLLAQGARLLSDDVTVIDLRAEGGPMVLPTYPRQKLWRDTLDTLDIVPGRVLRRTVHLEKFDRQVADRFESAPMRLDGVCQIHLQMRENSLRLAPLEGMSAVRMLHENVYRRTAAGLLGRSNQVFADCVALSAQLPHRALVLPNGIDRITRQGGELAALLARPQ
ncbi:MULTISPECIES: hypothetical protein [unclassified Sphingomonas]|nr:MULTISPECIES: hypothetical protein [unclassified Sphingomonas]